MILMSVFESIKRECFPSPRGWVMGHCSVGSAGRDTFRMLCRSYKAAMARREHAAGKGIPPFSYILFGLALILTLHAWAYSYIFCGYPS
jgi:hypothetical protein